jgi:hypothetical protein
MKSKQESHDYYKDKPIHIGDTICDECGSLRPDNISSIINTYPGKIFGDFCNDCANALTMYYLYRS